MTKSKFTNYRLLTPQLESTSIENETENKALNGKRVTPIIVMNFTGPDQVKQLIQKKIFSD